MIIKKKLVVGRFKGRGEESGNVVEVRVNFIYLKSRRVGSGGSKRKWG